MIEARGLTKRYGGTVAVDDLSFTVPPGQVTGFLGPNGAGKSTTMRLILGLDAPDSGSVTVAGAVAVLFGVLFVPTLLTALLPSSWQDTIGPCLPMNAGDTIYTVRPEAHMLGPWAGFGVFCLYAAAALAARFVLIGRRDA